MTPIQQKFGKCTTFKVTKASSFDPGDIIDLYHDDDSSAPKFKCLSSGNINYESIDCIEPYDPIKQYDIIDVLGDEKWLTGSFLFLADTTGQDIVDNEYTIKAVHKTHGYTMSFSEMRKPKPKLTVQIGGKEIELTQSMADAIEDMIT